MLLFQRILGFHKDKNPADRRDDQRYCISPRFPLQAVLNVVSRDDDGHRLDAHEGGDRAWTGRLINISRAGARLQLPRPVAAQPGEMCLLKLDLEGNLLELKGRVAHMTERRDSMVLGLLLDPIAAGRRMAYDQFIELIALGATLKPSRPLQPHDANYLIEEYEGEPGARLNVWRSYAGRDVAAFEFRFCDFRVRGLAGHPGLEFLPASEDEGVVAPEQSAEISRLFHWVVPNLPTAVPADVREFLLHYAA
ncbi:MAG TPA: PilZ domain-containing protein [Lacunisphaera sp.]|nr:PilZ domain-containing protein [Lacunisphaera sp.]